MCAFPSFRQKIIGSLTVSILLSTAFGSILFASPPLVDPFPIGIIVPPHPSQANMNTYAEIQNMNVNVIVGGNENVTKTTNEKALNLAEALGIKILVDDWGFHWKTEMLKQATTGSGSYLRNDIRIGQTFTTPTAGTGWIMERVEFQLDGTSCPAGATVTLSVYDSPAKNQLIANASRIFTCPSETTHPELLLPRNLTMDSKASYYMEFATTSPNNVGLLKTSDADVYEGGQAYVNGVPQSTDLAFEIRFYQPERPYSDGNMQSTVLLDDLANHYQAHPALLGYSLWDEPSSALFTKLEDATKRLHQIDPNHAVKVNLLPTYATNSQLGLDQLASDTATSIQPIGQTFQTSATQTTISTIQLWLDSASFQGGESVTLALWDSPAKAVKLAEDSLSAISNDWPRFTLNATVLSETDYYWELTHNGAGDNAVTVKRSPDGANWINGGTGYKNAVAIDADFWFTINQNIEGGTYEDYVYRWAIKRPDFLLYDHYPFLASSERPTYYENLEIIRKQALLNGLDFWSYIQSFTRSGYRFPNENELMYNIYSNLAYGAKGYVYYTFRSVSNISGLINPDGTRHSSYEAAKAINAEVLKLGPTLKTLVSDAVYHTGTIPDQTIALPASFFWQPMDSSEPLIIGSFTNGSGRKYVMVVNRDFTNSRTVTFAVSPKSAMVTEVSKTTGLEVSTNYNGLTGMLSSEFAPGEGRLFAITDDESNPLPLR